MEVTTSSILVQTRNKAEAKMLIKTRGEVFAGADICSQMTATITQIDNSIKQENKVQKLKILNDLSRIVG